MKNRKSAKASSTQMLLIYVMISVMISMVTAFLSTGCAFITSVDDHMSWVDERLSYINYTYKTESRSPIITKSCFAKYPNVGVAVFGSDDRRNATIVERGIHNFVHFRAKEGIFQEILYTNIGSVLELTPNHGIVNAQGILRKSPGMRYALYLLMGDPLISEKHHRREKVVKDKSDKKEKTVYDDVYESTLSVEANIALFDLKNNILLAKAKKSFRYSAETVKADYQMPEYPEVTLNDINGQFISYVYCFLTKISRG